MPLYFFLICFLAKLLAIWSYPSAIFLTVILMLILMFIFIFVLMLMIILTLIPILMRLLIRILIFTFIFILIVAGKASAVNWRCSGGTTAQQGGW